MPLRRLTEVEYLNTVRDLFGDPTITTSLPTDPKGTNGFSQAPLLSTDTADMLRTSAETLATKAVANFDAFLACDASSKGEDACADEFIRRFGRRAYRHTLSNDEAANLGDLYRTARTTLGYPLKDAIRVVVTAMLQSPRFLYHWEIDGEAAKVENGVVRLPSFELASRLSYFLWGSMPDDALLDAVDQGKFEDEAGISSQLDRMMGNVKFAQNADVFHTEWLSLDTPVAKDPNLFPQFNEGVQASAREEMRRFVKHVLVDGDGKLDSLFTSTFAEVDSNMASIYGAAGAPASGFGPVQLDGNARAGLLTRAALLLVDSNASQTNPPRAGKLVWEKILCKTIAPPPPGAATAFRFDNAKTVRQNFETLESDGACAGCHKTLNPIGYAFENFDAIGRYRTMDGSKPLDASGSVDTVDGTHDFSSIVELSKQLAGDSDARSCVARTWFHFAMGRDESEADQYSLQSSFGKFRDADFDLRMLVKSFAASRTFRYRAIEPGETP